MQIVHFSWERAALVLVPISLVCLITFFIPILPGTIQPSWLYTAAVKSLPPRCDSSTDVFRNATWKPEIGCWLNQNSPGARIPIVEILSWKECQNKCGGHGICNRDVAECRCYHGYYGEACEQEQIFQCNSKISETWPYGNWRVSICPAYCDTTRAFCLCGEGTKYPERPVAEACGFVFQEQVVDWSRKDNVLYSNSSNGVGWCNIDNQDRFERNITLKPGCDCKYDGVSGELCDIPTQCSCINQCSENGFCKGGFCECDEGWYGIDCSIPSFLPTPEHWPDWILVSSASINASIKVSKPFPKATFEITVERRRPLIYVYDLPAMFNIQLLQGRHFRFECVNRLYDAQNATVWTDQLYGAEGITGFPDNAEYRDLLSIIPTLVALLESLLASQHRTMNAEEADFFYVPVLEACAITRADDAPHMSMQEQHQGLRGYFSGDLAKKAYEHISEIYPFWNRSGGRDHIWFFSWDEGACSAPKEMWNSMMLVHWGNTNTKHNHSTTGYYADNWDGIPEEWRGNHPCYDPEKDLVLPAWKVPDPYPIAERLWARERKQRPNLFYFNGNLGEKYNGRPESMYSMGIRQRLADEFGSTPNIEGKLGQQRAPDVVVLSQRSENYHLDLSLSRFCGVLPGDGWSGRMEDSILHGCIPVIIQDGIHLPYENVLNYDKFSVRVAEDDLPNMVSLLRGFNESVVDEMLAAVQDVWQRFTYQKPIKLESKREKTKLNIESDWAIQYNTLSGDDAFDTFIHVLHFKANNDVWRKAKA